MVTARPLAEVYRRFAEDAAGTSPLTAAVARALGGSVALELLPPRRRQPALVLAALHDLALAGRAPALAAAYTAGDGDAAARAALDTLAGLTGEVAALVARRRLVTVEAQRCAVLVPAVAEAARRAGAAAVGLVAVGSPAGFDLHLDRVAVTSAGRIAGDPSSPVQVSVSVVGRMPVPVRPVPEVVARIGVDREPLDPTDPDDARWLRACVPPDRPGRRAELDAELALGAGAPVLLLRGDPVTLLADAVARVPAGALPVVTTTWALSTWPAARRVRLLDRLAQAAAGRAVSWVSVEGVGVAPGVPTLGDRPASGHSIVGLVELDGAGRRAEALGRCWSRGRQLSWLAVEPPG
ncbi:DUF2332 family protein [Modestobacter sp. I12A-02628]|uniref:DUF2332 family protein n=1 Tax=Goekera deserti TaxID=2497753 RepID=A0A7K3WDP7_9ACTN|nr:DUF2332 family protein [Goekera deserti]MPQ99524.1 DUF2332 family protein [Goekera deserti]NDI46464.1 DUF2332 family protein [Goekera deserti]NEL54602.1 DUF2332 family protein [Goekera deserti]